MTATTYNPREQFKLVLGHAQQGRLSHADRVARQLIVDGHMVPDCWNVIARLATIVRRHDVAVRALEAAQLWNPLDAGLREELRSVKARAASDTALPDATPSRSRLLVIRPFSQGFWAEVDHVVGQCLLAEMTGRTPVVAWGADCRYSEGTSQSAWEQFFEPVSDVTVRDVPADAACFPPGWTVAHALSPKAAHPPSLYFAFGAVECMQREERVVVGYQHTPLVQVLDWLPKGHALFGSGLSAQSPSRRVAAMRSLASRYLRPRREILAMVDEAKAMIAPGRATIAAHIRAGDKWVERREADANNDLFPQYAQRIDAFFAAHPGAALVLITDGEQVVEQCVSRFGADNVIVPHAIRTRAAQGLHFLEVEPALRRQLGNEVLRDVLLCCACDAFIGLGWSNVSNYVRYFKAWPDGAWHVLGRAGHGAYVDVMG